MSPDLVIRHLPWDTRAARAADAAEKAAVQRSIDQVYYAREVERLAAKDSLLSLVLDTSGEERHGMVAHALCFSAALPMCFVSVHL